MADDSMRTTSASEPDTEMPDVKFYEPISTSLSRVHIFIKHNNYKNITRPLRNSEGPDSRLFAHTFLTGYDFEPRIGKRELHILVSFKVQDAVRYLYRLKDCWRSGNVTQHPADQAGFRKDYNMQLETLRKELLALKEGYESVGAWDLTDEAVVVDKLRERFGNYDIW
jgi:hypothetical protein